MSKHKGFSDRLNLALDKVGAPPKHKGRQSYVGELFGVSQRAAGKWLEGEGMPSMDRLTGIAASLGVSAEWLLTGNNKNTHRDNGLVSVPLLSWVQAGDFCMQEMIVAHDESVLIPGPVPDGTFALKIKGESMFNPTTGEGFPDGCTIIVEAGLTPRPGDFVVARSGDEVVFKEFVIEGATPYLRPMNPRYTPIKIAEDTVICGVATRMVMDVRLRRPHIQATE